MENRHTNTKIYLDDLQENLVFHKEVDILLTEIIGIFPVAHVILVFFNKYANSNNYIAHRGVAEHFGVEQLPFLNHTMGNGQFFQTEKMFDYFSADEALQYSPFKKMCFVACCPIVTASGYKAGIVYLMDKSPMALTRRDILVFELFAKQAGYIYHNHTNSNKYYHALFDQNPLAVFLLDNEGKLLEANESAAKMMEGAREDILGSEGLQIFATKTDYFKNSNNFKRAQNSEPVSFDTPIVTLKGKRLFVSVIYLPVYINDRVVGVYGIAKDITARKSAEAELKEREYQLKLVLEAANIGWWDWDLLNDRPYFDHKWWGIIGYKKGEIAVDDGFRTLFIENILHPDDVAHNSAAYEHAVANGITNYEVEYRLLHKDGRYIPVLSRAYVTFNEDKLPIRVSGINMDISKVKEAEEIIEKTKDNLKTVFENTEVGFILVDENFKILSFNQPAARFTLTDYSKQLVVDNTIFEYATVQAHDENASIYERVKKGEKVTINKKIEHAGRETRWYDVSYSPVTSSNGKHGGFIISIEHITDRIKSDIELKKSFNLLAEQNKRLLNFSYIVSHNLRSHTSNIKSLLSFLKEAETPAEQDEMVELLDSVSDRLEETIHNLNEIVSIHNNVNLVLEPLTIRHYIKNAEDVLKAQIISKNVHIVNNVSREIVLHYNPAYLESILLNFLSNAIKYAYPGRRPVVRLDCYEVDGKVQLNISDNGIGIDLERYGDKLFGLYKTFHNNTDSKGVGLFLTKNQVDFMGGRIEVESEIGKGTTFKIFF